MWIRLGCPRAPRLYLGARAASWARRHDDRWGVSRRRGVAARTFAGRPARVLADSAYAGAGHTRISDGRAERGHGSRADAGGLERVRAARGRGRRAPAAGDGNA